MTTPTGTLIGFDFGERRIGVAVMETVLPFARALAAIKAASNEARFAAIDRLDKEYEPSAYVVGQPKHSDGSVHEIALLAAKFGRRLAARYRRPVMLVDETLSSNEAERRIREAVHEPLRTADIDSVAACIILETYYNDPSHARAVA